MADALPSYADRAAQLIADLDHAMQTNSPVSTGMMTELKDLLGIGVRAIANVTADEVVLEQIGQIAHSGAK